MRWVQVPNGPRMPRLVGHLVSHQRNHRFVVSTACLMIALAGWNAYWDVVRYDGWWLTVNLVLDAALAYWGWRLLRRVRTLQRDYEAGQWDEAAQYDDPITALACWRVLDRASYTSIHDAVQWVADRDGETWVGTVEELNAMLAEAPRTLQALVLAGMPPYERRVD